jgi:hypothetical protein
VKAPVNAARPGRCFLAPAVGASSALLAPVSAQRHQCCGGFLSQHIRRRMVAASRGTKLYAQPHRRSPSERDLTRAMPALPGPFHGKTPFPTFISRSWIFTGWHCRPRILHGIQHAHPRALVCNDSSQFFPADPCTRAHSKSDHPRRDRITRDITICRRLQCAFPPDKADCTARAVSLRVTTAPIFQPGRSTASERPPSVARGYFPSRVSIT